MSARNNALGNWILYICIYLLFGLSVYRSVIFETLPFDSKRMEIKPLEDVGRTHKKSGFFSLHEINREKMSCIGAFIRSYTLTQTYRSGLFALCLMFRCETIICFNAKKRSVFPNVLNDWASLLRIQIERVHNKCVLYHYGTISDSRFRHRFRDLTAIFRRYERKIVKR